VQAALASDPLESILEHKYDEPDFAKWEQWGNEILTTAVFSIILTAPLGMLIINFLGPRWLSQDVNPERREAEALAVVLEEQEREEENIFLDLAAGGKADGGGGGDLAPEGGAAAAAAAARAVNGGGRHSHSASLPPRSRVAAGHSPHAAGAFPSPPVDAARRNSSDEPVAPRSMRSRAGSPRGSLNYGIAGPGGMSLRTSVNWMRQGLGSPHDSPSNTLDASAKLEILTTSLRLQIEEQVGGQSETSTQMLGSLQAIHQLCHARVARYARPSVKVDTFDVPGQFFRQQKEDNMLLDASATVLSHSNTMPPER
jgi:hypothetical protein